MGNDAVKSYSFRRNILYLSSGSKSKASKQSHCA
jgi:hypothetical protein